MVIGAQASVAWAYEAAAVSNGGTIEGKVAFTGPKPPPDRIIPTKDREACGGMRQVEQVELSADKGLAEAVVWVKQVPRGKPWDTPAEAPALRNVGCDFSPHAQVVPIGREIDFSNTDPVFHNLHTFLDKTTIYNFSLPKGGRKIRRSFSEPGLVTVECDAHAWMRAWIYVADSPYYAMTGKDGRFTIGDLPPGSYTLTVWHHYTGVTEVPFTVAPGAKVPVNVSVGPRKQASR